MIRTVNLKAIVVEIIVLLYILLFVYAAVSKLLDFENFQVQLGQSPLISSFAGWVAIVVPTVEIMIAVMLALPRYRAVALLLSYTLMMMFTVYIYIILNYSAFIPCSCGGLLEKMNWDQHLVFNIVFMFLAAGALLFMPIKRVSFKNKIFGLLIGALMGAIIVIGLYELSENKMKYDNGFVRRFPQHSAQEIKQRELNYNSYYFAGIDRGMIYLGNSTSPLLITIIDTTLQFERSVQIELVEKDLPFRNPTLRVLESNFYVYEGDVPYVFKGNIRNWKAAKRLHSGFTFSQFEPIDSVHIAVRYINPKTAENIIGTLNLGDTTDVHYNPILLQKQIDGIFDTDGRLQVNRARNEIVYLYRYRNQYIVANPTLKLKEKGKTIDTVSKAKIKIASLKNNSLHKFSEPPLIVNKSSYVADNYLYVHSLLRGKYESDYHWKNTSTIDVYRLTDLSYQYSLSINAVGTKKMKSFIVLQNRLYALIDSKIIGYKIIDYKELAKMSP